MSILTVDDPARRSGWRATTSCRSRRRWRRSARRLHTPVGDLHHHRRCSSAIPFIQFSGPTVIAVGATASIYLSYLLGNLAVMRARTRGWPKTKAPFSLGRWGKVVNVVAIVWGAGDAAELPDAFVGERRRSIPNASGANYLRIFANPKADPDRLLRRGRPARRLQDRLPEQDPAHLDWSSRVVFIIGAIYYFAVQRKKPYEAVHPPDDEDLAGIAPAYPRRHTTARGRPRGRPLRTSRAIIRADEDRHEPEAAAYIGEHGGTVWVWLDPHRGLSARTSGSRPTANRPGPAGGRSSPALATPARFKRIEQDGDRGPLRLREADASPRSSTSTARDWRRGTTGSRRTGTAACSSGRRHPARRVHGR